MTATHMLRRPLVAGLASLTIAVVLVGPASATTPSIPNGAVVVSSTQLGSGSFTMTATNLGDMAVDLDLAAPGDVSSVSVDFGSFDSRWALDELGAGMMATMTGLIAS